jgi:hypothetical protein
MANVEHSTLTGSDLHEPKGVAAAAANRVYLSNGAGSGSWTTIPASAITAAGVLVFQSQKYHIRDEVSSGTSSQGALTSSSWNTRRLQTESTDDLTVTLSGNQFALPAGTYWCTGWSRFKATPDWGAGGSAEGRAHIRLRNITDSTTTLTGCGWKINGDFGVGGANDFADALPINGQFTIAGTKTFELQMYVRNVSSCPFTAGDAISSGENEVYSELIIWKLS